MKKLFFSLNILVASLFFCCNDSVQQFPEVFLLNKKKVKITDKNISFLSIGIKLTKSSYNSDDTIVRFSLENQKLNEFNLDTLNKMFNTNDYEYLFEHIDGIGILLHTEKKIGYNIRYNFKNHQQESDSIIIQRIVL